MRSAALHRQKPEPDACLRPDRVSPMTAPAPTLSDLNQVLADTPFLQQYAFRVESTAPGECTSIP